MKVLSTIVVRYPESAAAYGLMGGIYNWKLGKRLEAIGCFQKAVQLSPRSELSSLGLFHSLWGVGLCDEAAAEMRRFQGISHSTDYDEIAAELKAKGILS